MYYHKRPAWALAPLAVMAQACAMTLPPYSPPSPSVAHALAQVDWARATQETTQILSGYLGVNTSNPPGNEALGVAYLEPFLAQEGIETQVWLMSPGRAALVARLRAQHAVLPPLCLMHHVDVATADAAEWPPDRGPFSGTVDGQGVVWGRGALDMKGLGALEVGTLRWIKRLGVELKRDVLLLAVPDEEVDNSGMRFLIEKHWGELGCSHVINEGGLGIKDLFFPGQTVFSISVAEKGVLWLRLTAHGESGHGAAVLPGRAPQRLINALHRLNGRVAQARVHPSYLELLARVGDHHGGFLGALMTRPTLLGPLLAAYAIRDPLLAGAVLDTVQLTGLASGTGQPNVVSSQAHALLDVRPLPGTNLVDLQKDLLAVLDEPSLTVEVLHAEAGAENTWDDPLFRALAGHAVSGLPNAVVGPALAPLYSDSVALRQLGVRAFGFAPFVVDQERLRTLHGKNERVEVSHLDRGLRVLLGAVLEVSMTQPGPSPPPQ